MHDAQIRVAIAGAGGRMGRQLIQATQQMDGVALGAALEREGSSLLGSDAGELAGVGTTGVTVSSDLQAVKDDFDVLIDFTRPEGTLYIWRFVASTAKGWLSVPPVLMTQVKRQFAMRRRRLPLSSPRISALA
jgi:4-hydroxy-tetrahydrodipicolinate reductase